MTSPEDITERIERPIKELLHDANTASTAARNAWVLYLALLAYFFVALSSVTHKDLLLETPIDLPLVQATIPQHSFFIFGPLVIVLVHFSILLQHVMLSRKLREFHRRMSSFEGSQLQRQHRFRVQLSSYTYAQAIAGPERSPLLAGFLYAMNWITLGILPLLALILVQITYLPSHSAGTTNLHRIYIVADFIILLIFGVFLRFPEMGFRRGFIANLTRHPANFFSTLIVTLSALFFSFFIATIPDEPLDVAARSIWPTPVPYGTAARDAHRSAFWPTAYLFEGETDEILSRPVSVFCRNMVVINTPVVPPTKNAEDETAGISISLRGRDLRHAKFDRSSLERADFTGARLEDASFQRTVLVKAQFVKADLTGADMRRGQIGTANFQGAVIKNTKVCTEQNALDSMLGEDIAKQFDRLPCSK